MKLIVATFFGATLFTLLDSFSFIAPKGRPEGRNSVCVRVLFVSFSFQVHLKVLSQLVFPILLVFNFTMTSYSFVCF